MAIAAARHASRGAHCLLGLGELYVRTGARLLRSTCTAAGSSATSESRPAGAGGGSRHTSRMTRAASIAGSCSACSLPCGGFGLPCGPRNAAWRAQWRSPEELERRGLSRLRSLLAHAAHRSPPRELLAGVDPRDIKATTDLARVRSPPRPSCGAGPRGPPPRTARAATADDDLGSTGLPFELYWEALVLHPRGEWIASGRVVGDHGLAHGSCAGRTR
jgi:hypothetical protein